MIAGCGGREAKFEGLAADYNRQLRLVISFAFLAVRQAEHPEVIGVQRT